MGQHDHVRRGARLSRHRRRAGLSLVDGQQGRPTRRCSTAPSARRRARGDAAKGKDAMAQLADKFSSTSYAPRAALSCPAAVRRRRQGRCEGAARVDDRQRVRGRVEGDRAVPPRRAPARRQAVRRRAEDARRKSTRRVRGLFADLRGDALAAAGRTAEARAAYQEAFATLESKSPYRSVRPGEARQRRRAARRFRRLARPRRRRPRHLRRPHPRPHPAK